MALSDCRALRVGAPGLFRSGERPAVILAPDVRRRRPDHSREPRLEPRAFEEPDLDEVSGHLDQERPAGLKQPHRAGLGGLQPGADAGGVGRVAQVAVTMKRL